MTATIWDAVAVQAGRAPGAIAVSGERNYTYRQVMDRAGALARSLRAHACPGAFVAVQAATPAAGAIAILAAAAAGCPVLPFTPDTPQVRRAAMLADTRPAALVIQTGPDTFAIESAGRLDLPQTAGGVPGPPGIAYVMYTSGSTGRPKGVLVPHQALLDRLRALASVPGFRPGDSILAMSTLTFDISLIEMFMPLITGGSFVAAPPGARLDPEIFDQVVSTHRPRVIQATPSFFRLALAWGWRGSAGSRLWCGGEILTPGLTRRLLPLCAQLWNVYGPTETTLWATAAPVTSVDAIDLGKPLPGGGLFLAAKDGTVISEPGRPGEILLYGSGLACGYLNRGELTAQRFTLSKTPEGRRPCYRTGDLAKYSNDGRLEFLGRADNQIKLRGHRIELAELEAAAEEHPAVKEAAAVLRDADNADTAHIALFVVGDPALTPQQIRGWMADRLPAGMRPGRVWIQQKLPRTPSGKVDRISLATLP